MHAEPRELVRMERSFNPVVGVDVGGPSKGFHLVMLDGRGSLERFHTTNAREAARWCRDAVDAELVAVDAPCRWSRDGKARACERELIRDGIRCFPSPTREAAESHPSGYYDWMLNGAALFAALEVTHPLLASPGRKQPGRICFETFPHAMTRALSAGHPPASGKRAARLAILEQEGVKTAGLSNQDWIDAALCALCAQWLASGRPTRAYGTNEDGWLIVPLP